MRTTLSTENIQAGSIKDLITKFFYKDNNLCFQLLLQLEGGEIVFFREFTDYSEYKETFGTLQKARKDHALTDIIKNNIKISPRAVKVA